MDYQNGQFISAYTANDTLFEGKVFTRKDGTKVCLREDNKWLPLDKLKMIRVVEGTIDTSDIQSLIDDDIGKCDMDKIGKLDDGALEKLGASREDELIRSGVKMDKGAYSQGFISKVKAQKVADDANAGNISTSTALEKYKQSKDIDIKQRINQTLKENLLDPLDDEDVPDPIYDSIDDENATFDEDYIDESSTLDENDFSEEDDPLFGYGEDDGQDWDAIEDAVENFDEDDIMEDDFTMNYTAFMNESKGNGGYDRQKDKDYDDALSEMDKKGKSLPDSPAPKQEESSDDVLARLRNKIAEKVDNEVAAAIDRYIENSEAIEEAIVPYICKEFGVSLNFKESESNEDMLEEAKKAIVEARLSEVSVSGIFQVCKAIYPKVKSFLGGGTRIDTSKQPTKVSLFNPNVEFTNLEAAKKWCQQNVNKILSGQTLAVRQLKVQAGQPVQQIGGLIPVATR